MADLPTYLRDTASELTGEENYQEELNATLLENFGNNGIVVTSITNNDLTITPIIDPNTGLYTTVANLMPNGTEWYVTDASPPARVVKINGSLVKYTTTAYP